MTLTHNDLQAIDIRIEKALEKNNEVLEIHMAEILAENNSVLIQGLEKFIEKKCETQDIKSQLRKHEHRLDKIEAQLA